MRQSAQKPSFTPFGTEFRPIGFINGKPVWPVIGGADGDEGSSGTGSGDGNEGDGGGGDGQGKAGDGNEGTGDGSQSGQNEGSGETVSKAEFEALQNRMRAADRRASTAESELKKRQDAEKSELEKLQAENADLKKRDSERDEQFRTLQTKDAFRDASSAHKPPLTWHNFGLAMKELNRDLITVEDDGTVKGMEAAVKKLATDHPYLVKEDGSGEGAGQASGGSFNGKKTTGTETKDKTRLAAKYPQLRGRGGNYGT